MNWNLENIESCLFYVADDESAKGVCHYGGLVYQIGQKIPAVTEDQPCKTDCFCVSSIEQ